MAGSYGDSEVAWVRVMGTTVMTSIAVGVFI